MTGYQILRRELELTKEFSVIADAIAATSTTYTDATVVAGTKYTYRAVALNGEVKSALSLFVNVTVRNQDAQQVPGKPSNLSASAASDSVVLTWDDPSDTSITGYQVLRRRLGDADTSFTVLVSDTQSASNTYTDTSVLASNRYAYKVRAINSAGMSRPSGSVTVSVN